MRKVTHARAAWQIAFVWLWATLIPLPPLLGWGAYIPEGFMTSCTFDYLTRTTENIAFVWFLFAGGFVLPVMVVATCYVNIVLVVFQQADQMAKIATKGSSSDRARKKRRREMTTAKIVACTVCLFVVSWLPYAVIALSGIVGKRDWVTPYTVMIPVMVAKASCMWNPILYALTHPKFRAALETKMPWSVCTASVHSADTIRNCILYL